jgi:hypothetical protein
MEQIVVTHPDGVQFSLFSKGNVCLLTKAEQTVALLAGDTVSISVQSAVAIQFQLGDKIDIFGKTYTLNQLPSIKKYGERRFDYELNFEGVQYELLDVQFLLPDSAIGDSFTGNLLTFLQILLGNINRVFAAKWKLGEYPDETEYKTLTFSGENCLAVLQQLCEEYSREFEITQDAAGVRTLNIGTAGADFPYTFYYGRSGGLYELTRQNINSKNVVTRLFAYGGSNNIPNRYLTERNSSRLCLPNKNKNGSYIQDAAAIAAFGIKENAKTFDDIFPNRYGEVTAKGNKYNAFVDNTMNFDLNEKDADGNTKWLIDGVNAKVHFNTGNLAGYEFEVHKYDHASKTIELVPFTDENGMKFPSETSAAFQFGAGDKYFFIDINLPDAYITEAEQKLQTEATEYYAQNSQPQVQYGLTVDENFLKQFVEELTIVNLFAVGDYIHVEDSDIGVNKSIRITAFTRDLLQPYKYSITLGESVTKSIITRIIAEQKEIDQIIAINNLNDWARARRAWRDSQELLAMVFDTEGDYFTEKIKPLSIETNLLSVGAKSTQFGLIGTIFEPNYGGNKNVVKVTGGTLVHYTLDENSAKTWTLADNTTTLGADNQAYYIYAKCQRSETAGSIIFSTSQISVESDANYYHFWIGIINSIDITINVRSISLSYGFTMINGKFIKTGRIESSGGSGSFFDLDNNQFRIGNNTKGVSWNENGNGKLLIKGTLVQSQSGDEQPLGCFRGAYDNTNTYYKGDEVTYNGSTYRYINDTASSNKTPTNTTYWVIVASGGQAYYTWIKYADDKSGNGISDSPDGKDYIGFAYNKTTATESNNKEDYTWSLIAGTDGVPGPKGEDGQTLYTWIKYSNSADGSNMYDVPAADTMYIGIAVNKTTQAESSDKTNYIWSKFKGDQGVPGTNGENGAGGVFFEYRYAKNGSTATPPILENTITEPSGWTTTMPTVSALEYLWMTVSKKSAAGTLLQNWSAPIRTSGVTGDKGDTGPSPVFRGDYSSSTEYYGTNTRVDIVRYNDTYYVARTDAGDGFTNKVPTNTSYWNTFGAQFDSIATRLLLAEGANIAGWVFRNNRMETQGGKSYLDGSEGVIKGYMVTPYVDLGTLTSNVTLNFDNGFNYIAKGNYTNGRKIIYLPTDIKYNGAICLIFVRGFAKNDIEVQVRITGGSNFYYPGYTTADTIYAINVFNRKLKLEAMPNSSNTAVMWYIDNYNDFDSGDFVTS